MPGDDLVLQVADELRTTLRLGSCWYEEVPLLGELPAIHPDGSLSTGSYRWTGTGFELPRSGAAIPLRVSGRLAGRFVLAPSAGVPVGIERRQVATAIVDQLGLVLALRASA